MITPRFFKLRFFTAISNSVNVIFELKDLLIYFLKAILNPVNETTQTSRNDLMKSVKESTQTNRTHSIRCLEYSSKGDDKVN